MGVAQHLSGIEGDLLAYGPISRTNVPDQLAEPTTFMIRGIDPEAVLVVPETDVLDGDAGHYRLLWGPRSELAYPTLCDYLSAPVRLTDEHCGAPA